MSRPGSWWGSLLREGNGPFGTEARFQMRLLLRLFLTGLPTQLLSLTSWLRREAGSTIPSEMPHPSSTVCGYQSTSVRGSEDRASVFLRLRRAWAQTSKVSLCIAMTSTQPTNWRQEELIRVAPLGRWDFHGLLRLRKEYPSRRFCALAFPKIVSCVRDTIRRPITQRSPWCAQTTPS